MQEQAKAALQLAVNRMKWYYDQKVIKVPFKIENLVLLKSENYQSSERALAFKYLEPFPIVKQLTKVTFILKMPPKYRAINSVFHAQKLYPYTAPFIFEQVIPPSKPVQRQEHQEYEVEKILQHCVHGKWKKN